MPGRFIALLCQPEMIRGVAVFDCLITFLHLIGKPKQFFVLTETPTLKNESFRCN